MKETQSQDTIFEIPVIPKDTNYWFVRAQGGAYYADFKYNNYIAIGDNEIKLSKLDSIEDRFRLNRQTLIDAYKQLFYEQYADDVKHEKTTKQGLSISANKTFSFIEEFEIGDIVMVPDYSSIHFLIGIIISEPFDHDIDRNLEFDVDYEQCDYEKKRYVYWFKEISREHLSEKMYWLLSAHQTIFNLTKYAEQINPLISSVYAYKGMIYSRIQVRTEEHINADTWFEFQKTVKQGAGSKSSELYIQKDVESPGDITFQTIIDNWEAIVLTLGLLFGDSDTEIYGVKLNFKGPLSYFLPGAKKRREHQEKAQEAQLRITEASARITEAEADLKEIEVKEKVRELESAAAEKAETISKGLDSILTKEERISSSYQTKIISMPVREEQINTTLDDEQIKAITDMKLTNVQYGTVIEKKMQKENLNV